MSRETIRDRAYRTIGYIEREPDGRQKVLDAQFRTRGHYDPRQDVTTDAAYRTVARGNVLPALIFDRDC